MKIINLFPYSLDITIRIKCNMVVWRFRFPKVQKFKGSGLWGYRVMGSVVQGFWVQRLKECLMLGDEERCGVNGDWDNSLAVDFKLFLPTFFSQNCILIRQLQKIFSHLPRWVFRSAGARCPGDILTRDRGYQVFEQFYDRSQFPYAL